MRSSRSLVGRLSLELRSIFVGLSENSRRNEETLKTCLGRVVEGVFIFVFGVL